MNILTIIIPILLILWLYNGLRSNPKGDIPHSSKATNCPNYREKVVGRNLISRGHYERHCSVTGSTIEEEYAYNVCCNCTAYKTCSKAHRIVNRAR